MEEEIIEDKDWLYQMMKECLTDEEILILSLRRELFGCQKLTPAEIASVYGVARQWINELEDRAYRKLRKHCMEVGKDGRK